MQTFDSFCSYCDYTLHAKIYHAEPQLLAMTIQHVLSNNQSNIYIIAVQIIIV